MALSRSIRDLGRCLRWPYVLFVALLSITWTPATVGGQEATPAPIGASPLQDLLGLLPAEFSNVEDLSNPTIYLADIALQLDTVGYTVPETMDDAAWQDWFRATRSLMVPSHAAQQLRSWRADYGFDLLQTDQTLSFSAPPFDLSIYRGTFDSDEILARLSSVGYTEVEVDGRRLVSIRGDYEMDPAAPTAYKMAAMNFGVVLDERTIAFSSAGAPLAAVLDVIDGLAPSAMESAGLAMLIGAAPPDLASAVIVPGATLAGGIPASVFIPGAAGTPDLDTIATEIASTSEMPPVALALVGSTAGGPVPGNLGATADEVDPFADVPDARAVAIALMPSPELAQEAVPVVEERLATGVSLFANRPYTEFFANSEVRAQEGQPILLVDLTLREGTPPHILIDMLFRRDLIFLAW